MDNFDKKVQETLKQVAEGVNPSPHVEQRIHDEILSRCPELRKQIAIPLVGVRRNIACRFNRLILLSHILTEKNTHLF